MSTSIRAFFLGALLLALARGLTACGSAPACGPDNCQGCCTADGICAQPNAAQCGARGALCQSCGVSGFCMAGICVAGGGGNGGGTSGGNSTSSSGGSTTSSGTTTSSGSTGTSGWPTSGGTTTSCTSPTSSTTSSSTSTSGGNTSGGANQPPVIASFSANPTTLHEGESTTLSAIVSDPDGAGDLAGGTLVDPASEQTYGAFSTPGGQGTFTYSLSWDALQAMGSLDYPAGGGTRSVKGVFFDNHGHTAEQTLVLTLACATSTDGICGGACVDFQSDPANCGGCGVSAPDGGSCSSGQPKCASGHTDCGGTCLDTKNDVNNCGGCGISCSAWASAHGLGSTHLGCDFGSCVYYADQAAQQSCDALCAAAGTGLTCFARESCYTATGGRTSYSNGACAKYTAASDGSTCVNEAPLSCGDVPAATISDCTPYSGGAVGAGNFTKTYCSCGG